MTAENKSALDALDQFLSPVVILTEPSEQKIIPQHQHLFDELENNYNLALGIIEDAWETISRECPEIITDSGQTLSDALTQAFTKIKTKNKTEGLPRTATGDYLDGVATGFTNTLSYTKEINIPESKQSGEILRAKIVGWLEAMISVHTE